MPDTNDQPVHLCGGEIDAGKFTLQITSDDLQPAEITVLLGLQPTESYLRGDFNSAGKLKFNHGSWAFATDRLDFRTGSSCEQSFDAFMRSLPGAPDTWRRIAADNHACVLIVLWMRTRNREFDISTFALGELARRRMRLHIDTYLETDNED